MSTALGLVVDFSDRVVDWLRHIAGMEPLPPLLLKAEFDEQPTVHRLCKLSVEMRRTFYAELLIQQAGVVLVKGQPAREGSSGFMPRNREPITWRLTQESRYRTALHGITVTETIIDPLPNGPPINAVDIPASVVFPGPVPLGWDAPYADRVLVTVIEDGKVSEYTGAPSGQIVHHPARPSHLTVQLIAQTAWGQTRVKRTCECRPPELRIEMLSPAEIVGEPGSRVRFAWRGHGVHRIGLLSPGCAEPQLLDDPHYGALEVTLGMEPAEFHVIARGYGGAQTSVVLRAVPHPFASLPNE